MIAPIKITKPIVDFKYKGSSDATQQPTVAKIDNLSEQTSRPSALPGTTYKLKSPIYDAALYITITDIILNPGTPHEQRRPFEIFINSRAMSEFQWITALSRMISAVFRKGGDVTFVVEQLKSVCDPKGGYFKNRVFVTSIVAEIGMIIEEHLVSLGLLQQSEVPESDNLVMGTSQMARDACPACNAPSLVYEAGCAKCLSCGWSRCG